MNTLADCVHIPRDVIEQTLAAPARAGKRQLEPLKAFSIKHGLPVHILEDTAVENEAEAHRHEADLWICIDGEVEFIVGGEMVEPRVNTAPDGTLNDRELKSRAIKNGSSHTLGPGDLLWIPAGQPHLHRTQSTARLYIIKIPVRDIVPLESVPGWKA